LEIVLDRQSNTNASIKISLQEADYKPNVEKKLKEYSKKISLKGFRQGKVPIQLVQKMYGKAILAEEVNTILSDSLFGYIRENDLPVVGEPIADEQATNADFDNAKDFEFAFKLGLAGDFEMPFEKLEVVQYNVQHTDEQVLKIVDDMRNEHGTYENPEVAGERDLLSGTLNQILASEPEEGAENQPIKDKRVFISLLQTTEAASAQLVNLSKGAVVKLDLANLFTDGDKALSLMLSMSEEEVSKLEGEFEFTVQDIHHTVPAELNEEFFKKIYPNEEIADEAAFLAQLKENLSKNFDKSSEYYVDRQVRDQLVKLTDMELPDEFLKEWLARVDEGKFTPEQIEKEYEAFANQLRWDMIKNRIIKEQQLQFNHEEIMEQARRMISSQFGGFYPDKEKDPEIFRQYDEIVINYLKRDNGRFYQNTAADVLEDKVYTYIRQQISPKVEDIDQASFEKLYYQK
jgi:trigger factor